MASTFLTRTIATATGTTKGTFSCWVKRANLTDGRMFSSWGSGTSQFWIMFSSNKISIADYDGSYNLQYVTNRLFRDTSAWSHIVVAIDTTLGTSGDRVKLYVNGVQETSFSTSTAPSQNQVLNFSNSGEEFRIGKRDSEEYLDGSMTHIHFTDGYAYPASTFGETDSTSGIWKPKTAPSVTYGTNGFFLKFENSGAMGTDSSGNSNTFTVSGTPTQNVDTPSNNFATMNPLDNYYAGSTFTTGNLSIATVTGNDTFNNSTLGYSTGKFYWETKATQVSTNNYDQIGITSKGSTASNNYMSSSLYSVVIKQDGNLWQNAGSGSGAVSGWSGSSWTTGDIIGIAHDATNNKIYVHKNGVYMNSGNPSTGANGITTTASSSTDTGVWLAGVGDEISSGTASQFALNFGQGYFGTTAVASAGTAPSEGGIFEYDCPSGYQALCTKGINSF